MEKKTAVGEGYPNIWDAKSKMSWGGGSRTPKGANWQVTLQKKFKNLKEEKSP